MGWVQPSVRTTKAPIFVGTRSPGQRRMHAIVSLDGFSSQPSYMPRLPLAPDLQPLRNSTGASLRTIVLAVALAFATGPAAALSLGTPEVASSLGQPLQMRVPVVLDDPSDGSAQCLRIISQPGSDVPTLVLGRLEIERAATGSFLRV